MNLVSDELATLAGTVMLVCTVVLTNQRLAGGKSVEMSRLIWNRSIAVLMVLTTSLAWLVFHLGYPVEAGTRGLSPRSYWTILAFTYCALMVAFAVHLRWRSIRRTASPFVW